jgi:hypothetical protein
MKASCAVLLTAVEEQSESVSVPGWLTAQHRQEYLIVYWFGEWWKHGRCLMCSVWAPDQLSVHKYTGPGARPVRFSELSTFMQMGPKHQQRGSSSLCQAQTTTSSLTCCTCHASVWRALCSHTATTASHCWNKSSTCTTCSTPPRRSSRRRLLRIATFTTSGRCAENVRIMYML